MLYLIDYIAYGLHLWYDIGNVTKTYFPTSWLDDKSGCHQCKPMQTKRTNGRKFAEASLIHTKATQMQPCEYSEALTQTCR